MKDFVDLLRIYTIDSELVRFGCNSDGGYVLPVALIDDCEVVYVYGVGSDISFETDLLKYKEIKCCLFDHTVNELPVDENNLNLKFIKEGLSFYKTDCTDNFLVHVERNKDDDKKILLKIDIEGSEYEYFEKTDIDDFSNVVGIILELHWIKDNLNKACGILDKINTKFVLTHAHGNNFGGVFFYDDQVLPDTIELTFANRCLYKYKAIENRILPIANLDFPCNKDLLDYLMVIPDAKVDKDYYRRWVDILRKKIMNLDLAISEKDKQIQAVTERGGQIAELEAAVGAQHQAYLSAASDAANLRNQLDSILVSWSWKLTAPLRRLYAFAHRTGVESFRHAIAIYRALPISPPKKQQLKNAVFHIFGFAFVRLEAYQRWAAYRQTQTTWPTIESAASPLSPMPAVQPAINTLPAADGTWEWRDYDAVKSRISQIKARRLAETSPSPLDLIDIGNETLASAAARVSLPSIVCPPDVSIIIPVFNNIKLTLECLLSICAHNDSRVSYEIILADDASTDKTAQVCASIPYLRLIRHERNLGFLQNCNHALKHVQGSYVLYLNNDVQVTAGWLHNLLDTFGLYPKVGAVGPRLIYPNGYLQEAGAAFRPDGTADMLGLNEDPTQARFSYTRRVDYVSGVCLMLPTSLAKQFGGFSKDYLPCYYEDSDLCLRVQEAGYFVYCNPTATIVHHLSKTTDLVDINFKLRCISKNLTTLQSKWSHRLDGAVAPKIIAFYLPQFHPFDENDKWWGSGFTEWTSVTKARPNFVGHYQPRLPADLGYYDLRLPEVLVQQAELARRYGIQGFCFYYFWFGGKRLLERPIEQMLATGMPDFPFCLCWANENWTRKWDGQDHEVLMPQSHSPEDDRAVILDLIRFFRDQRYIRIDGRPLILVYRVTLFPNFAQTAGLWRSICREQGIGEIYIAMVESFELVYTNTSPNKLGCDASVEFPPQGLAETKSPTGRTINSNFSGSVADYRDLVVRYATREIPAYTRFRGVVPGWDNTARRQNTGFCFEHATPGSFQAWMEEIIEQTRIQHYGDERVVFVNAWNEWAEGAYLEPDQRFGHSYLEAVKNAVDAAKLLRKDK